MNSLLVSGAYPCLALTWHREWDAVWCTGTAPAHSVRAAAEYPGRRAFAEACRREASQPRPYCGGCLLQAPVPPMTGLSSSLELPAQFPCSVRWWWYEGKELSGFRSHASISPGLNLTPFSSPSCGMIAFVQAGPLATHVLTTVLLIFNSQFTIHFPQDPIQHVHPAVPTCFVSAAQMLEAAFSLGVAHLSISPPPWA